MGIGLNNVYLPPYVSMITGGYIGDGNLTQSITGIGGRPRFLKIYSYNTSNPYDNNLEASEQDAVMGLCFVIEGGWVATGNIISLDADGFTVGNQDSNSGDNYANEAGVTYSWIAWL